VADARRFTLDEPVDAVFSNATLHWVAEPEQVVKRMWSAMKPGARLVVEFGGRGNVAAILSAIANTRTTLGLEHSAATPWYFPSISEYASILEQYGFEVQLAQLYDRPTPLQGESGLTDWLQMFAGRFLADIPPDQSSRTFETIEAAAKPLLYRNGQWWADYRRIRVLAVRQADD
jgi:trans-aconitate 2-methyltransferase